MIPLDHREDALIRQRTNGVFKTIFILWLGWLACSAHLDVGKLWSDEGKKHYLETKVVPQQAKTIKTLAVSNHQLTAKLKAAQAAPPAVLPKPKPPAP